MSDATRADLALPDVTRRTTDQSGQGDRTGQPPRPTAAAKPVRWAAEAVAAAPDGIRPHLDHSAQSLWRVDRLIEELRREGSPHTAVANVLRGFGAYAGEVIVRQTGAEWWGSAGDHWVRTPDGRLWEPLDESRRCFGGHGSLRLLCRDAMSGGAAGSRFRSRG
ncbi:hypothetical protein OG613_28175 [Streptomyces sp. NBC_00015]|uniref:hypothetical protein n=1 Tax=unclassified Streptomyces TaxID=2593676 RepID=UPI002251D106|nr:hypothetical protein [Streptomyces sp. NBC_00103]MCX5368420.1 hypothetical protein [Streptomyces sp. NBC_00103]